MRVKEIGIKNFRSIRDLRVRFDGSSNVFALVGRNDVGKTNILSALDLVLRLELSVVLQGTARLTNSTDRELHFQLADKRISLNREDCTITIDCQLEFSIDELMTIFGQENYMALLRDGSLQIKPNPEKKVPVQLLLSMNVKGNNLVAKKRIVRICDSAFVGPLRGPDHYETYFLGGGRSEVGNYSDGYPAGRLFWFISESIFFLDSDRGLRSSIPKMDIIQRIEEECRLSTGLDSSYIAETESLARELGLSLQGLSVRENLSSSQKELYLDQIPHTQKGSGTNASILLCSHLAHTRTPIVIIEEPELHLHPDAQRSVVDLLLKDSARRQFIISTHSPVIAGHLEIDSVVLISKENGMTIASRPGPETAKKVAIELGVHPSDLIYGYKACVFVEGPRDVFFWRTVLSKLKEAGEISLSLDEAGIGFVMSGGENIQHWISLDILDKINSRFAVILDSDRRAADQSINQKKLNWKMYCEQKGGKCFILRKREIENYLGQRVLESQAKFDGKNIAQFGDFDDFKALFGPEVYKLIERMTPEEILETDKYPRTDQNEGHELLEIAREIISLSE